MVRERRKSACVAAVDKQLQVVADVEPPAAVSLRVLDGLELAAQLAPRHCTGLTELGATQLLAAPRVNALPRLFAPAALGLVVLELECVVVPAARALQRLRCGRFLPLRRRGCRGERRLLCAVSAVALPLACGESSAVYFRMALI